MIVNVTLQLMSIYLNGKYIYLTYKYMFLDSNPYIFLNGIQIHILDVKL
jgi:hypothetical protein